MKNLLLLLLLLVFQGNTHQRYPVIEEKRLALIIGNTQYEHIGTLKNAVQDATDIAEALKGVSFEVKLETNLNLQKMEKAIVDFVQKIQDHKSKGYHVTALVYYAGHGIQYQNVNYLLPTNALVQDCAELRFISYELDKLLAKITGADVKIAMFDACRTAPKNSACLRDLPTAGLKPTAVPPTTTTLDIALPRGTIISYAAAADQPAQDGVGRNSPYATAFLKMLREKPDYDLGSFFEGLENEVWTATHQKQESWRTGSIKGAKFYFKKPENKPTPVLPTEKKEEPKKEITEKKEFPKSYIETVNGVSFEMMYVEGGKFNYQGTKPIILDGFYVGKFEVTQRLWRAVMGRDPLELYNKGCDECPVDGVSWYDIMNDFLPKLNKKTGKTYSLPTEAEWEYSASGGQQSRGYAYAGSNTIDEVAWYNDNYRQSEHGAEGTTHPVGKKKENELGLYDMSGNVREWCLDAYKYDKEIALIPDNFRNPLFDNGKIATKNNGFAINKDGSARRLRGGSWLNYDFNCRVQLRNYYDPRYRDYIFGVRLVRTP